MLGLFQGYRKRGLGKHLLNFALNRFKGLKASKVELVADLSAWKPPTAF
jgi:ribosomal protein S18 acetylase RimI-like enzyme